MDRDKLIDLIMEYIYTRRAFAEKLADKILELFNGGTDDNI